MAFITLFPHSPARQCIYERREHIVEVLDASRAAYPDMPIEVIATVGFLETHLGCARNEGGGWGAPIDIHHRHTAGTPMHAARALWRSYEVCNHDWEAAARRFRTGLCGNTPIGTRYGRLMVRVSRNLRLETQHNRERGLQVCETATVQACFH